MKRPRIAIVGLGQMGQIHVSNIARLIEKQSRRRQLATAGESRIPVDDETRRCLKAQGYTQVYNVREGMAGSNAGPGWLARKLPVEPCSTC